MHTRALIVQSLNRDRDIKALAGLFPRFFRGLGFIAGIAAD